MYGHDDAFFLLGTQFWRNISLTRTKYTIRQNQSAQTTFFLRVGLVGCAAAKACLTGKRRYTPTARLLCSQKRLLQSLNEQFSPIRQGRVSVKTVRETNPILSTNDFHQFPQGLVSAKAARFRAK
jgi:hypothetical protein